MINGTYMHTHICDLQIHVIEGKEHRLGTRAAEAVAAARAAMGASAAAAAGGGGGGDRKSVV